MTTSKFLGFACAFLLLSSCTINGKISGFLGSPSLDISTPSYFLKQIGALTRPASGGVDQDECLAIARDTAGNIFCAGYTFMGSVGEPTSSSDDAFVMKLDPNGNVLWIKQLGALTAVPGGDAYLSEDCKALAVDSAGDVYCAGQTTSSLGDVSMGGDVFIMKLRSSDGALVWLKQFGAVTSLPNGTSALDQSCNALTIDAFDNLYCGGYARGSFGEASGGGRDVMVMKLDSSGNLVWLQQFGGVTPVPGGSTANDDECLAIAVDGTGNIYCSGSTRSAFGEPNAGFDDALVLKLDNSGALLWARQLGTATVVAGGDKTQNDICQSVAVDGGGNVYCGGQTYGALGEGLGGGADAFVMKLSSAGAVTWIRQLGNTTVVPGGSTASFDLCLTLAVDGSGNVFCGGYTYGALGEANGGSADVFVMKLSSAGALTWIKQFGATSTGPGDTAFSDVIHAMAMDASGNFYLAGSSGGNFAETNATPGSGNSDLLVLKLDSNGDFVWARQIGGISVPVDVGSSTYDACYGIAVDSAGNIYCAGETGGALGEANGMPYPSDNDMFISKMDKNGNLLWIKQFGSVTPVPGGDTSQDDVCLDIAVDSAGYIYCAGETRGSLGEANGGGLDAFVMKLNSSGNIVWVRQLGAVTVTPGGDTANWDSCSSVDVDTSGNVYCGGYTDGALGEANSGASRDAFVMKLNSSGNVSWIRQLGAATVVPGGDTTQGDICYDVSVSSTGHVYCAGNTDGALGEGQAGGGDAFIMRLNSNGTLDWIRQLGNTTVVSGTDKTLTDRCYGVDTDSQGNAYCAGETAGSLGEASGGSTDAFVMKVSASGVLVWVKQLGAVTPGPGNAASSDRCLDLAVDVNGNLYCTGYTNGSLGEASADGSDMFVMKMNSDGNLTWLTQLGLVTGAAHGYVPSFDEYCDSVTVDGAGAVYVGCATESSLGEPNSGGNQYDMFVLKLNPQGQF